MYWLQRPQYLRRITAVVLMLGAVAWDLRSSATEQYPRAAHGIPRGDAIDSTDLDWVEIPAGLFPLPELEEAVASRDISAGEPLSGAVIAGSVTVPNDWWTVPLEVGSLAVPGDEILLVVAEPPLATTGIVVVSQVSDRYSLDYRPAAVAVPPDAAPVVAAAEREGLLVTAARTGGDRQ